MEKERIAIISFISEYRKTSGELEYESPDGEEKFIGSYTNEAPLKYLLARINKDKPDSEVNVYLITSKTVYETKCFNDNFEECAEGEATKTMYDYYSEYVIGSEKTAHPSLDITVNKIPYDYDVSGELDNKANIPVNIYKIISKKLVSASGGVYIENTGGMRDAQYLIASLIRYLEMKGIECKAVVYSNFQDKKIYDIKYVYDTEKVTDAVNDFKETGAPNKLIKLFEADGKAKNEQPMPLLFALRRFNHALALGELGDEKRIDETSRNLTAALTSFEKSDRGKDIKLEMLYELLPEIKKSLHIEGKNTEFGYPEIVKWCVEHRFLQQAITICIDKFPEIYYDKGIGSLGIDETKGRGHFASVKCRTFYEGFYDSFFNIKETRFEEKTKETFKKHNNEIVSAKNDNPFVRADEIEAYNQLCDYLFDYLTNRKPNEYQYGSKEIHNTLSARVSTFMGESYKFGKCFFKCESENHDGCETCKYKALGTYEKKTEALKYLKECSGENGGYLDTLIEIMDYYLILKAIRNRVNHASTGSEDDDYNKAVSYFSEKYGYGEGFAESYSAVKEIVLECARLTASIKAPLIKKVKYDELTNL